MVLLVPMTQGASAAAKEYCLYGNDAICLSEALEISLKMSLMALHSILLAMPLMKAASITAGVTAGIVAVVWHEGV